MRNYLQPETAALQQNALAARPVQQPVQQEDPLPAELERLGFGPQFNQQIGRALLDNGEIQQRQLEEYQTLDDATKRQFWQNVIDGMSIDEALTPQGYADPARLTPYDDSNLRQPQAGERFDDAQARQVADLDAFKLMQLQPEYEEPAEHAGNSTDARKLQLLRRAMFADAAMEDPRLSKAMTRLDNNIAGRLGALGRLYTDDEYELGRLMSEQYSSAILRGDSGAQTPEPEVQRYQRQYFPLPGETDQQIDAKRAMRREEIRALIQSLPAKARPAAVQIQKEIDELRRQADVPDGSLGGAAPKEQEESADGWQVVNGVKIRVKQ